MSTRFHGLVSVGLVGLSILVAVVTLFQASALLGLVYLAGCALAPLGIVYAFCAKCPCRGHCAHVVFGKLAMAFTNRRPGAYSKGEVAVVIAALLWLLGPPQVWLWRSPVLFAAFWGLNVVAVVQIRAVVCPNCENVYCPLKLVA